MNTLSIFLLLLSIQMLMQILSNLMKYIKIFISQQPEKHLKFIEFCEMFIIAINNFKKNFFLNVLW